MTLKEIIQLLEQFSPPPLAMDWDKSGLQCGRLGQDIQSIMVAVDATEDVIKQAVEKKVDLLVTHHPFLFSSLTSVTDEGTKGSLVYELIEHKIACYSMHTNYDVSGMGEAAAKRLGITNAGVLELTFAQDGFKAGIGRVGLLPKTMTLKNCAVYVKEVFGLDSVRVFGDLRKKIKIAAVCPGSGKHMAKYALKTGADVLITGDIDHHEGIDAVAEGLAVIDAGHYGIEKIFVEDITKVLNKQLPGLKVMAAKEKAPFVTL
ncbi:MAG: Nif3-like dinuclear metal center hexameric protein [Lachnospiraceae bacterium]|nr:Nif3-like dinuclear metal center hexameric protein [Lachnospiraceae bacterium]